MSCGYCGASQQRRPVPRYGWVPESFEAIPLTWCEVGQRYACADEAACAGRIRAKRAGAAKAPGRLARLKKFWIHDGLFLPVGAIIGGLGGYLWVALR